MRVILLALISALSSCAYDPTSARSVSMKPGKGGVVTLSHPQDPRSRAKGDEIMNQTCAGKKAEVTEEGEAVVGTATKSNTEHNKPSSGFSIGGLGMGGPSSETEAVAKQVTEWRITYECK
ncbi:MAG: hypothetical protein NT027_11685 [Proteobacteria bacterium]|nr:hypothetical protein [Pseudomonadota bacterium]